jgi:elongator complex protein 3
MTMDDVILDIVHALRERGSLDARELDEIIRAHSKKAHDGRRVFAKKHLLPYYFRVREQDPARWESWHIDEATEAKLIATLRMKPRRTASGVATVTVITKPWTCTSACSYCPNDVRMPKSYLHREPACQRAERNFFDPYLQVTNRLRTLAQMGHPTDKVELIVLGGTWCDYPDAYQLWFVSEMFRALNELDDAATPARCAERRRLYEDAGIASDPDELARRCASAQQRVNAGEASFNEEVRRLYGTASPWEQAAAFQQATLDELERAQRVNEAAAHRVVGLVVETRPDTLTPARCALLRRLGCTKVQIGVQSLDEDVLRAQGRAGTLDDARRAFRLLRLFGFKLHAHYMVNLPGSDPARDIEGYRRFATEAAWAPDEVKLYPVALVAGTGLVTQYEMGTWRPYTEDELVGVLATDVANTPPYLRVSRMIRDISAQDILAGNKKTNLRQMVESRLAQTGAHVDEIRYREIGTRPFDPAELALSVVPYETDVTRERFLQWTCADGRIVGFLRLSLPDAAYVRAHEQDLPIAPDEAMIREVHVYGAAARIHRAGAAAQHHGLGHALVERACEIARDEGYARINVISSVGTREYYRHLGFRDNGLYQTRELA